MIIGLVLAFIEGLGLILSPCILPVLPIVLAASADGGRKKPFGIILGFISAFTLFAVLSRQAILALGIDGEVLRHTSLFLLVLLGAAMMSEKITAAILKKTEGLAHFGASLHGGEGFTGGLLTGALIGLVWTPCAGPIMAAAVIGILQAQDIFQASLTVLFFVTGAGLPMLAIALYGREILQKASFFKKHAARVRQALGGVIIVMALLIWNGYDALLIASSDGEPATVSTSGFQNGLENPYAAPEITGIESWINSDPLLLENLKGKVVLIDFWTYSCINCVRTLPHVTAWDRKYRKDGLVIIGIHAPEFSFEKKRKNVEDAVKRYNIQYPVALDNKWGTWTAFKNRYWPAHYLIDRQGRVVYTHFGEGNYAITEGNIRNLLGIKDGDISNTKWVPPVSKGQTPETYLGTKRRKNFTGDTFPTHLPLNGWALSGEWQSQPDRITAVSPDAALRLHFNAQKVFLVTGADTPTALDILVDGARQKTIIVDDEKLYEITDIVTPRAAILELRQQKPGISMYAFTFGR